jgi:archaeal flagellin FlaB
MLNKLNRAIQRLHRGEKGITGLETAIILIAFVTVASVLGYSVLSAGIFSSEKGKETVYQGLAQAQASMEVKGSVYANVTNNAVTDISFTLASVLNDQAVDMTPPKGVDGKGTGSANTTVISYTDSTGTYNDVTWTETPLGVDTGDTSGMLKPNEQMTIDVTLPKAASLGTYGTFTIQIVPATGAAITIERTLPGLLGTSVDLN